MSEAIAQKLDEARALIEKGWCQHSFIEDEGDSICYCADAALAHVFWPAEYRDGRRAFCGAIGWKSIWDWNDAPERTQAEVIDAFKKAAELARGLK